MPRKATSASAPVAAASVVMHCARPTSVITGEHHANAMVDAEQARGDVPAAREGLRCAAPLFPAVIASPRG